MEINTIWSEHRPYLVDLAFRMLGRIDDAEDVVQDAFARLLRADLDAIEDVRGWLVVVVSRLCLDYLRSAHHRREANTDEIEARSSASVVAGTSSGGDPADRITLEDNIRLALFVVLEQLSPAERAVFVLHDIFQFTFDDVASIVGRTPAACRQIASRARRRIENETGPARFQAETGEHHLVAQRFIAACAGGDLEALMELLDSDVVGDVDVGALTKPLPPLHGPRAVGRRLLRILDGRSHIILVSQPLNGNPGVLAFRDGQLVRLLILRIEGARIKHVHAVADPKKLAVVAPHFK
jgi:RNA polymerase sigma-70 factor (ECF subfamily)